MEYLLALLIFLNVPIETAYSAVAIATCESGNTKDFGTLSWRAVSKTDDGGAFQFNVYTWKWLSPKYTSADKAPPRYQVRMFLKLFAEGNGIAHWNSSKPCWSKWLDDDGNPIDNENFQQFVLNYMEQKHD